MEAYRIENLTFSYPNSKKTALDGLSLSVEKGGFVVICGASGCGKTTLLRQLKPQAAPHGDKSGKIFFEGAALSNLSARDAATKIGFVMQSPENQIVTSTVWHELAFGLESLGAETSEIRLRVAEISSFFGIQEWFRKSVTELSGGQKQILALASIMAMQPSVLILDEPTSQLDPVAAGDFLSMVSKINRELGVTIILTEHRLEEVFFLCSHAVVMEDGRVLTQGAPGGVGLSLPAPPTPMRVWAACGKSGICPITVRDGAKWLETQSIDPSKIPGEPSASALKPAVQIKDLWFRYEKNLPDVIKGLSFTAHYGETVAVLGGNGTGKTTVLSLIAKINAPYRGKINSDATAYVLPQDPQTLFTAKTVIEDLHEISRDEAQLKDIIALCRLDAILESHPYDLSGGEQQRAALAKVLLLRPKILLLDEPTKGLDAEYKKIFAGILCDLKAAGAAVIIVSHDIEFCAEYADRCALFFDGEIVTEGTPRRFFSGNSFYTTAANRMARDILPNAVTAGDIICAIGGQEDDREGRSENCFPEKEVYSSGLPYTENFDALTDGTGGSLPEGDFASRRNLIPAAIILFTIPATIFLGMYFLDNRQFYIISMLIILQTMLPFVLLYEGRKPQARELVLIAVLCALAVAGRVAFFMVPQFKPVLAIIIISGVALGGHVGFLVGAMVAFVSNMYFGQGPWTPWQMFAFGITGFLAGVIFRKGRLKHRPLSLAIFGGISAIFIYGGIMNPANVLIFQPNPTFEMFALSFFYAMPFDIIHALATITFLLIISRPMLEKLDRVREKFGLLAK